MLRLIIIAHSRTAKNNTFYRNTYNATLWLEIYYHCKMTTKVGESLIDFLMNMYR